jgi:hypothetical protein
MNSWLFREGTELHSRILSLLPEFKNSRLKILIKKMPLTWLAHLITKTIKPRTVKSEKNLRLLVLDHSRFRDDLEALDKLTQIEFLILHNWVQRWITAINDDPRTRNSSESQDLRARFLARLLSALCKSTHASGFISCGFYYEQNLEWEIACTKADLPFFCLHREMVGAELEPMNRIWAEEVCTWRRFHGHILMIATASAKEMLVQHNYLSPNKIVVTGAPRFDLVKHSSTTVPRQANQKGRGSLLLFSFPLSTAQPGLRKQRGTFPSSGGFQKLFYSVHRTVAQFAADHPEIPVIIRPKWYASAWKEAIDNAVAPALGNQAQLPENLQIIDNIGAQELVSQAGAVISLNSTTGIEALIHSIPSILPHYEEAAHHLKDHLLISENTQPFFVARSETEFKTYLEDFAAGNLKPRTVPAGFLEKTIGPAFGDTSARIEKIIIEKVTQLQSRSS